jgi:hypothetical protein
MHSSVSMDDAPDLVDTAVWDAYGKNDFAGSGLEAAMKRHRFSEEQAEQFLDAIVNRTNVQTEDTQRMQFEPTDPGQTELDTVLNTLDELDSMASNVLETEYNHLVRWIKKNANDLAKEIKRGGAGQALEGVSPRDFLKRYAKQVEPEWTAGDNGDAESVAQAARHRGFIASFSEDNLLIANAATQHGFAYDPNAPNWEADVEHIRRITASKAVYETEWEATFNGVDDEAEEDNL